MPAHQTINDDTMLRSSVRAVLLRDIAAVRRSVEAYPDDASVWAERDGLPNVAGTIVLHLAGNLQHFVGVVLGGRAYHRDRPAEFSRRNVPRAELLADLAATELAISETLATLPEASLAQPFPETIAGNVLTTGAMLVHLATHLAYHLGQLDYHRRVVTGDAKSIGAMMPGVLAEIAST